jgi:hypothetical protein
MSSPENPGRFSRLVCHIADKKQVPTGRCEFEWDLNDTKGRRASAGVHFVRAVVVRQGGEEGKEEVVRNCVIVLR